MREFLTRNVPIGATASAVGFFAASLLKAPNPFGGSTLFSNVLTRGWDFLVSGGDFAALLNVSRTVGYSGGNLAVRFIATLIAGTKPNSESMILAASLVCIFSYILGEALAENGIIQEAPDRRLAPN